MDAHTIDWTTIIVSLGTVLLNGLFVLLSGKRSKAAKEGAESARTHADRAVQASLRPKKFGLYDECSHCGHWNQLHNSAGRCIADDCNCLRFDGSLEERHG